MAQHFTLRFSPDDDRAVQALQAAGVNVSEVMRRAVREEAARLAPQRLDGEAIRAELLRQLPDLDSHPRMPRPDATDRRAVQAFLHEKAKARHRKIQDENR